MFHEERKQFLIYEMNWYEDTPVIRNYYEDLTNILRKESALEVVDSNLSQPLVHHLSPIDVVNSSFGNFGLIKGRTKIRFLIKDESKKVSFMEKGNSKLRKDVADFLKSERRQGIFDYKNTTVQVVKVREETNYKTYWYNISNEDYSKAVVFKDIVDMDSLEDDLLHSIMRMENPKKTDKVIDK